MTSRSVGKIVRKSKAAVDSIIHPPRLNVIIPAQQARPAPPLGPQLGKRNVNIANFCKEFNERTKEIREGTPIPCRVSVNPDRSYILELTHPPSVYLLRLAAAAKKGSAMPGSEACGRLTLKHIYHIAELKKQDPKYFTWDLQKICTTLIGQAHMLGIEIISKEAMDSGIVDHSADGYAVFLRERDRFLEGQKREMEQKKQAKMLRLG